MSEGRAVLITGASSGIGRAIARLLAERGFSVFGTSRDPARAEPRSDVPLLPLDVHSEESVAACVEAVVQQAGGLDVLINNAGYVLAGAIEEVTLEQARDQFETNFFGVMRMVKAVLPRMRAQHGGQIVNVGSMAGLNPIPFHGLYSASKFALEGYTETLRHELKPLGIRVSLVEPGFVHTNLGGNRQVGSEPISDYDASRRHAFDRFEQAEQSGPDPKVVADTVLRILEHPSPRLRYLVGKEKFYCRLRQFLPESMFERGARRHWHLDRTEGG